MRFIYVIMVLNITPLFLLTLGSLRFDLFSVFILCSVICTDTEVASGIVSANDRK